MARRLYRTMFGIPLWMITGLALFMSFSVGYDLIVGDKNFMRYAVLGSSIIIIILSIILHLTKAESIGRQARKQMGG